MTLGQKIRLLRKTKGWSVDDLAKRCSINPTQIRQWEGGFREPKFSNLKKIAKGFGDSLSMFEECVEEVEGVEESKEEIISV